MKRLGIVFAVCSLACAACQSEQHNEKKTDAEPATTEEKENIRLADFNWLLGKWVGETGEGTAYEQWHKSTDTSFDGLSYFIVQRDTVSYETIRLFMDEGSIVYEPQVRNQNQGLPVQFKLKQADEQSVSFENPEHDFPKRIEYQRINADSVVAVISGDGEQDSLPMVMQFPMHRQMEE